MVKTKLLKSLLKSTKKPVFAGPTRPSTDVKKFRKTGKVVKKAPVFAGPTRPSTDVKKFRETGEVKRARSRRRTRERAAKAEAEKKAKEEARKKAEAKAKEEAKKKAKEKVLAKAEKIKKAKEKEKKRKTLEIFKARIEPKFVGKKITPTKIPKIVGVTEPKLKVLRRTKFEGKIVKTSKLSKFLPSSALKKLNKLRIAAAKDDKNAKAALIGIASLPIATTDVVIDTALFMGAIATNPSETVKGLANIDFKRAGANFGVKLSKGDPKALAEILMVKGVKAPKLKNIKILPKNIQPRIKNLKNNLKIKKLIIEEKIRKAKLKKTKSLEIKLKKIENQVKRDIANVDKGVLPKVSSSEIARFSNNLKKKNKKTIKKLFESEIKDIVKPPKIKIIKVLPKDPAKLNKLLLEARKVSGTEFKKLRQKIKKELNLNVVQRGKGDKISFKVLEPKIKKIIPKKKKVKIIEVTKEGEIIGVAKKKKIIIEEPKKLTKKELKDLEFEEGQKLDQSLQVDRYFRNLEEVSKKGGLRGNKKAQLHVFRSYKRFNKKQKISNQKTIKNIKNFQKSVNNYNNKVKNKIKDPKLFRNLKNQKIALNKVKAKLKTNIKTNRLSTGKVLKTNSLISQTYKNLIKIDNKFDSKHAISLNSNNAQIKAQDQALKKALDQINELKFDDPIKGDGVPKVAPKVLKKPPVSKFKPLVKKVVPKLKVAKARVIKKPPVKVKKIKKIKLDTKKLKKGGSRKGYLIKIKKGNKVLFATTQMLPLKRAKNLARKFTDNTIGASHSLVEKGKTNILDVKNLILKKKFRPKKSKTKKVQKEVEKRKFRLDKKQEKKGIKKKRVKKSKKK